MRRYVDKHSFDERLKVATNMLKEYPDRIPILCEPVNIRNINLTSYTKTKYLAQKDLTVGKFLYMIRKQLKLNPETAIFLYVNNTLPLLKSTLYEVYQKHKASDGFLYLTFCEENTFG